MKYRFKLAFLSVSLAFSSIISLSQTVVPFSLRYQTTVKGNISYVSNTVLECDGGGSGGANCSDLATQTPPTSASWSQNNDHTSMYVDIDTDPGTFCSSADSLLLNPCSEVLFAGIYWGGRSQSLDADFPDRDSILIDINGGGYVGVKADVLTDAGVPEGFSSDLYSCFADITDIIKESPTNSQITIANLYTHLGGFTNRFGGWNIAVVYEDDLESMRQLSVFDGYVNVNAMGEEVVVNVTDFSTPATGAVEFEVGVFGYDGDRGLTGDSLLFDGGSGFVAIENGFNLSNDIFNSSQTRVNALSTSQVPSFENNISIDSDIFSPDNSAFGYIGNAVGGASIKAKTNAEPFFIQLISLAMDSNEPDPRLIVRVEDINGGTTLPGDTLEYTVVVSNSGTDQATDNIVTDTLKANEDFVPGSIEITFGPNLGVKTDAAGDDQATYEASNKLVRVNIGTGATSTSGGEVNGDPTGLDSTVFTFRTVVSEDCLLLSCEGEVRNEAYLFGEGDISGNEFAQGSDNDVADIDGCTATLPTVLSIDVSSCLLPNDTIVMDYCESVLFTDALPYDELGYSYFDNGFIASTEPTVAGDFYAIYQLFTGCSDSVLITINDFREIPSTANAGLDQTVCVSGTSLTLNGNNPTIGAGTWAITSGTASITDPSLFNSEITGLSPGTITFEWSVSNGPCPTTTSADEVDFFVDDAPTIADAGPDQFICLATSATLAGNDPAVGTGIWSVVLGTATISDPTAFNSTVTGLGDGENILRWTITNGSCPPSTSNVILTIGVDTDNDGQCDATDLDADNDGILNSDEDEDPDGDGNPATASVDTDEDGVPDYLDLDSDNDGVADIIEANGIDTDGDGRVDGFVDLDMDGLHDPLLGDPLLVLDSDMDGVVDIQDLDSDNDGMPDLVEAGGVDLDGEGKVDDLTDTDMDGLVDLVDTDNDLIPGPSDGGIALLNYDTDGDDFDNRVDLDSDNDGISDTSENGGDDDDGNGVLDDTTDTDGDGLANDVDTDDNTIPGPFDGGGSLLEEDADLDGVPNYRDSDSDNDGIVDPIEAGGLDENHDGQLDGFVDIDMDGFSDLVDTDDNTTPEILDGGIALSKPNTDGFGGADMHDIDSDGDGISDNIEAQPSVGYVPVSGMDTDGDGWDDAYDPDNGGLPFAINDHDGDLIPDYLDLDSDDDGESDLIEGHDLDGDGTPETVPTFVDSDFDGLDNAFDVIVRIFTTAAINGGNNTINVFTDDVLADADLPDIGNLDFRENDSDGDTVDDAIDLDDDNDGITDSDEGTADSDNDGIADNLDLDSDNDGIPDIVEAGVSDTDGNGRIDGFVDGDLDGLDDTVEADPIIPFDSDGDGIIDGRDLDSDNDAIPDIIETGGEDSNGDGRLDDPTDSDGDGFGDLTDTDNDLIVGTSDGGTALPDHHADADGLANRIDRDSDNDGIPDTKENDVPDVDSDGEADGFFDDDNDGYSDFYDGDDDLTPAADDGGTPILMIDFDRDGLFNHADIDADNDGLTDVLEAGGADADGDGRLDDFADVDGDGFSDVTDTDNNTIAGTGDGGTALPRPNTDGIGAENYRDIDSDGDGIIDNIEGQSTFTYILRSGNDTDNDGLDDAYDANNGGTNISGYDHDMDGEPDYIDLNSDNDSEDDLLEGHDLDDDGTAETTPAGADSDGDGLDNAFDTIILSASTSADNGGNGTVDPLTDGTIADASLTILGDLDFRESSLDTDQDGIPNVLDSDDDNDGIPDLVEDWNEDGDGNPETNPIDTDEDGIYDFMDLDSDNDGIADIVEARGEDVDGDGKVDDLNLDGTLINDTDADGLDDFYDSDNGGAAIANIDTDGDGQTNFQDLDSDNDGLYDVIEGSGIDEDNDGKLDDFTDGNDDGWNDDALTDGFEDTDGDLIYDYLDLDSDNDATPDLLENGGIDMDGDGRIDGFEDSDSDGADDTNMFNSALDTDGDGVSNHEDLDSDNDGITDTWENNKPDDNLDGIIDDFEDTDGDGWDDDNQMTNQIDTDGDGIPNDIDSDSDGDGISDLIESGGSTTFEDLNGDGLNDTGGVIPPDSDEDGQEDYLDLDADNDNVLDAEENDPNNDGTGPDDTDGDEIPDYLDIDDDNDTVLTSEEAIIDAEGNYVDCNKDGLPDYLDAKTCNLFIPEGFSPDGDGINDFFVIEGITAYENASITIFNRWGSKVYESTNGYPNDWDGTNQFGVTAGGNQLPVGTYYYVLDLGDDSLEPMKGFVFINK